VKLVPTITLTSSTRHLLDNLIIPSREFYEILTKYKYFDILTYSISPMALFWDRPIKRLIYAVGIPPRNTAKRVQLSGTHAKLWLCYSKSTVDAYIGSANATEMTIHDLTVKLTPTQTLSAKRHFDDLWNLNHKD